MKNSFTLLILALCTSLLATPDLSRASSGESSSVELLTYSELMQLPKEKRTQYIDGVRLILIDLAKRADGRFSDRDPAARSRLKAWLQMLDREMQTAHAEDSEVAPVPRGNRRSLIFNIRAPSPPVTAPAAAPTSDPIQSFFKTSPRPSALLPHVNVIDNSQTVMEYLARQQLDVLQFNCISKERLTGVPNSTKLPACSSSVEAQIQKRFDENVAAYSALETESPSVTRGFARKPPRETVEPTSNSLAPAPAALPVIQEARPPAAALVAAPPAAADDDAKVVVSRQIPFSEMKPYLDRKENPRTLCEAEARLAGTGPMELVSIDGQQYRFCMTKAAEEKYKAGDLKLDEKGIVTGSPQHQRRTASETGSSEPVEDKGGEERKYSCAPKVDVCEVPKSAAAKIFKGGQTCVFAGMLSSFNAGNTRCKPQTEFNLGDKKYTCTRGQTMCNPLLFGTVSATKPICIGHAPNATALCSKLSSSMDAEKFLDRAENGLQEKWDDFRKALAETCKPKSDSAKFHCEECNIMKTRIFDLQARLLTNPCFGGRSDDGDHAIDLRIKLRGPKSSGTKN
jgi:hypothetical protein